jgi:hypothetical protein
LLFVVRAVCSNPAAHASAARRPEQTITAMLAVGSKPGGPFTRVDKGTYTLADTSAEPQTPAKPSKPKRRPAARRQQATKPAK